MPRAKCNWLALLLPEEGAQQAHFPDGGGDRPCPAGLPSTEEGCHLLLSTQSAVRKSYIGPAQFTYRGQATLPGPLGQQTLLSPYPVTSSFLSLLPLPPTFLHIPLSSALSGPPFPRPYAEDVQTTKPRPHRGSQDVDTNHLDPLHIIEQTGSQPPAKETYGTL